MTDMSKVIVVQQLLSDGSWQVVSAATVADEVLVRVLVDGAVVWAGSQSEEEAQ